jgi:hypothetical protein
MFGNWLSYAILATLLAVPPLTRAAGPQFVGMGDSIGEGVQSADASVVTQVFSYVNLIGARLGGPFPQAYLRTNPFAFVGGTIGRSRINPAVEGLNLAVSGTDVDSMLHDRADATINSETDLILSPRLGSQLEIAEALQSEFVACWIGNNDALGAALAFNHLDGSQLTPLASFIADFTEIADRLQAIGSKVVFGTIPDVSSIAFLLTRDEVIAILGSAGSMAPGDRTTIVTALLIRLGLAPTSLLSHPDFVLTSAEAGLISQRIAEFNAVIKDVAAARGMGVADMNQVFETITSTPPVLLGIPVTTRFLGGIFSLDAVHPSNIGQAVTANVFINAFNATYGAGMAPLSLQELLFLFLTDPFVDHDQDGTVRGRPGAGLLESVMHGLGISGDPNDFDPGVLSADRTPGIRPELGNRVLSEIQRLTGKNLQGAPLAEITAAFGRLFGLERFQPAYR